MTSRRTTARIGRIGFGVLAVADTVLAGANTATARRLRYLTKPLLMPTLTTAFVSSTDGRRDLLRQATLGAHAFSWGGDLALLGRSERAFLTGVGSFFVAHVAYITGFASTGSTAAAAGERSTTGLKAAAGMWALTAPVMAVAAGRKDPALRLPIAAYATALATMFATSTLLNPTLPPAARHKVVLGTSLFLVSDAVLGLQDFLLDEHSPALESLVMATYTAGQWFIADGVATAH